MAPSAVGAWVVEMDPAPDSIALSMARISWPRTSPTICRDRLNRKESNKAWDRVNSPA